MSTMDQHDRTPLSAPSSPPRHGGLSRLAGCHPPDGARVESITERGDPEVNEPELQRLARLFAPMCTAALDPSSLGISESAIRDAMEGVAPDDRDG